MGWFSSDEVNVDEKVIDSTGQVNTNIIIQEANDTHTQALLSERLLIATYFMVFIEIIKLTICGYGMWKRQLKKKYDKTRNPTDPA